MCPVVRELSEGQPVRALCNLVALWTVADRHICKSKVEKSPALQYPLNRCDQKRVIVFTPVMKFLFAPLILHRILILRRAGFDALRAHEKGHMIRELSGGEREKGGRLLNQPGSLCERVGLAWRAYPPSS